MTKYIAYITLDARMNGGIVSDVIAALLSFFDLIRALFNFDILIYNRLSRKLNNNNNHIRSMFEYVGRFDATLSVADLIDTTPNICRPVFCEEKSIKTQNIYHPMIEACTPNSLNIREHSMLFIGSNMSGKTTFMRTIGVNAILAQCFSFCFAESYIAPYFKIATSIHINDNMQERTSYYQEEVLSIERFTQYCRTDDTYLFIIDEIFKGTNTRERIAIAKAVLSFLNTTKDFVMVTTHDIELEPLLDGCYLPYYFEEDFLNDTLIFRYKLHKGDNPSHNAIKLMQANHYPEAVVETAIREFNDLKRL